MKVYGFLVFVICDVIFCLTLKRRIFRDMANVWLFIGALMHTSVMSVCYLETMRGEGIFGFNQEVLNLVEFWFVIVLCAVMVLFHMWAFVSKLDD